MFDKLDVDHDGTVDRKELEGRISAEDWKIADPDNDKTISKAEYLAFVEVAFKRANPDNDGSIDAKELKSSCRPRVGAPVAEVSARRRSPRLFQVARAPAVDAFAMWVRLKPRAVAGK